MGGSTEYECISRVSHLAVNEVVRCLSAAKTKVGMPTEYLRISRHPYLAFNKVMRSLSAVKIIVSNVEYAVAV